MDYSLYEWLMMIIADPEGDSWEQLLINEAYSSGLPDETISSESRPLRATPIDWIGISKAHAISGISNYKGRSKWERIGEPMAWDLLDMALIVAPVPNWKSKVMASQRQIRRLNELMS